MRVVSRGRSHSLREYSLTHHLPPDRNQRITISHKITRENIGNINSFLKFTDIAEIYEQHGITAINADNSPVMTIV